MRPSPASGRSNEAEQVLELHASAGMYTHLDGTHSRVPVGQFKIGLIARNAYRTDQRCPADPRISDHAWARREGMVAFAGYPLLVDDDLFGVVALFARQPADDSALQALALDRATLGPGHPAQAHRGGTDSGQGSGRGGQPGQEPVSSPT